ncbi:hypothetical protein HNP40_003477 [Mycobacteroides chelonae]|nr:hypothetical protein [Mycobacteroides chelonae]
MMMLLREPTRTDPRTQTEPALAAHRELIRLRVRATARQQSQKMRLAGSIFPSTATRFPYHS